MLYSLLTVPSIRTDARGMVSYIITVISGMHH